MFVLTTGTLTRSYQYDAAGNTLSDGMCRFTYNGAGRLTSATRAGMTTSYMYNALGQRIQKANAAGSTLFAYDEQGHLIGEYDQNGLVQELVWLGDIPVATLRTDQGGTNTGLFYIHTDHLNAPTKITRTTNNEVIWRWDHDPYGNGTPNEDPDGNGMTLSMNLRFPGQYLDSETGLYYNGARYYDPQSGRHITSDPIGLAGGQFSTYGYVDGNPITNVDPFGLAACTVLFPNYPINTGFGFTSTSLGGHGGVVTWDAQGVTRYYEYGRYQSTDPNVIGDRRPADEGNVRRIPVPNLVMDPKTGQPTPASMEKLRKFLSDRAGDKTKTDMTCDKNADEKKVNDYAENFSKKRPPYSWKPWSSNQCRDFAENAYGAGR